MLKALLIFCFLIGATSPVSAHKVVASGWMDGTDIEGEIGFSNGEMAADGTVIEVFDDRDNKIGETTITEDGLFRFTPKNASLHRFRANLGAGHVAEFVMTSDEYGTVAKLLDTSGGSTKSAGVSDSELQSMISQAVRQEVQPLRKEIAQYKEKNDLQAILGGIGYILGLTGVAFYVAAKRKGKSET